MSIVHIVTVAGSWLLLFCAVVHGQNFTRCYETNNMYYCYYTNRSLSLRWSDARQFCLNRSSTLPLITDANIQSVFEQFLNDSNSTSLAWIAAHTVPVNSSSKWHWIDGRTSSLVPNSENKQNNIDWCTGIRNDTGSNTRLILEAAQWTNNPPWYICQFNDSTSCGSPTDGFMYNSMCYKYYKEKVRNTTDDPYSRWFTAVNRCLSKNGSLAVFDDNFLTSLGLPWLSSTKDWWHKTWIGFIKSWWTWSDAAGGGGYIDVLFNKFNTSEGVVDTGPPYNPPQTPSANEYCAAAGKTGYWLVENCDTTRRQVVCQSVSAVTSPSTTTTTTTTVTTTTSTTTTETTASTTTSAVVTTVNTQSTTTKGSSNAASVGLGVGLGVGLFVVVIIVVIVIIAVVRRRNNKHQQRSRSTVTKRPVSMYPSNGVSGQEVQVSDSTATENVPEEIVYGQIVTSTKPIVDQTVEDSKTNGHQDHVIYADLSNAHNDMQHVYSNTTQDNSAIYANAHKLTD